MSTKKAIVENIRELVLRQEPNADNQGKLHFKRVEAVVGYAFDTLLSQIQMQNGGEREIESYFVKHYYEQDVLESNGYRYVGLNDDIVPLDNGRGIWYVKPSGGAEPFAQFSRPELSMFSSLPMGAALNETLFRIGNVNNTSKWQVVLENAGDSRLTDVRKVDYGIVRTFSSYGDDEDVRMPDGRYDLLMQMSREAFNGQVYSDNINNNE